MASNGAPLEGTYPADTEQMPPPLTTETHNEEQEHEQEHEHVEGGVTAQLMNLRESPNEESSANHDFHFLRNN